MPESAVSLDTIKSLSGVLARLPQGSAARELAQSLGLWSQSLHQQAGVRQAIFPNAFARLSDPELSDQNAYWLSEVFRATELLGLLEGQRTMLTMESKSLRAKARARLRRKYRDEQAKARAANEPVPKDPTAAQLADEVEEDAQVQEHDGTVTLLGVVLESAKAYKEACLTATAGISREISFRQAQMGAKLR